MPRTTTLSTVINKVATTRNLDPTKAGKLVRAHIRRNRDSLAKSWPSLNDRNKGDRYNEVPVTVANALVKQLTK